MDFLNGNWLFVLPTDGCVHLLHSDAGCLFGLENPQHHVEVWFCVWMLCEDPFFDPSAQTPGNDSRGYHVFLVVPAAVPAKEAQFRQVFLGRLSMPLIPLEKEIPRDKRVDLFSGIEEVLGVLDEIRVLPIKLSSSWQAAELTFSFRPQLSIEHDVLFFVGERRVVGPHSSLVFHLPDEDVLLEVLGPSCIRRA